MSPSAYITTRVTPGGAKRYVVRYRRGGRAYPLVHAGSFRTRREAQARLEFVRLELSAGRDPMETIRATADHPQARTVAETAEAWLSSRVDAARETRKNVRSHLGRILPVFGDRDPAAITPADVRTFVAALAAELRPASVKRYVTTLRQILDFAGVTPNPARDGTVRLPRVVEEEPSPPTAAELVAILERVPPSRRLPLVLIEQTGMASGEVSQLAWGDVSVADRRIRLRRSAVKAAIRSRARWVQVPDWLMDLVAATCPPDDRTAERRVFPGCTPDVLRNVMARACRAAGTPLYSPHDLRHRRASLWHWQGVPARQLAERLGHSRPSMSLDVYSHTIPPEEAPAETLRRLVVRHR